MPSPLPCPKNPCPLAAQPGSNADRMVGGGGILATVFTFSGRAGYWVTERLFQPQDGFSSFPFPASSHSVKHICPLEPGRVRAQTLPREATSLSFSCPFTTSCSLYGNLGGRYTSITWARIALDCNQMRLGITCFEVWNHCEVCTLHSTGIKLSIFLVRFPGLFCLCIYNR